MKLIVNGRNIELTDAIKAYVEEKVERLEHHFDFIQEIHVYLAVDKNPRISDGHHAEATVVANRGVMRVEVSSEGLYGSIDLLVDKIDRVLRKHKTKLLGRTKHGHGESIRKAEFEQAVAEELSAELDEEDLQGVFFDYNDTEEDTLPIQPTQVAEKK